MRRSVTQCRRARRSSTLLVSQRERVRKLLSTSSFSQFEMARLNLEAEGIRLVITNELSPGLGVPFTISVADEDFDRARALLREVEGTEPLS